jgi:hypothetical protein
MQRSIPLQNAPRERLAARGVKIVVVNDWRSSGRLDALESTRIAKLAYS